MVTWYISHCLAEHSRLCEHSPNSPKTRPPMIFRFLRSNGVQVCTLSCSRTFFLRLLGEASSLPCPNMAEIWHRMALTVGGPLVLGCHTAPLRKERDWMLMTFLLFPGITGSLHPIPEQDDGRFQQWYVLSAHVGISLPDGAHFIKSRSVASYTSIQTPF